MLNSIVVIIGKIVSSISSSLKLGHGSTWPGHIALSINKNFIKEIVKQNSSLKIILIAGTNGKTTTGKLIQTILEHSGKKVFQNEAGANLLNGIASSMLLHSNLLCKINYDYGIFEVDEAALPLALKEITPDYIILLNLFRDQLDRYGEVNTIVKNWQIALKKLSSKTTLVLNSDDPQIAHLSNVTPIFYFGLNDKKFEQAKHQHAVDSTYCPNCKSKLYYHTIYYSHLGDWECKNCGFKRPKDIFSTPLSTKLDGVYNQYNILAATLTTKIIGISQDSIKSALGSFVPAFGRQEAITINGRIVKILLSKNPTSFNESLRAIKNLNAKNVLFVLNDRIPDGRDVSWIWDVDFEDYIDTFNIISVSGDRVYDMAVRIKYASKTQNSKLKSQNYNSKLKIYRNLNDAITNSVKSTPGDKTLYILPTYSAMLEVRKILIGKKIL